MHALLNGLYLPIFIVALILIMLFFWLHSKNKKKLHNVQQHKRQDKDFLFTEDLNDDVGPVRVFSISAKKDDFSPHASQFSNKKSPDIVKSTDDLKSQKNWPKVICIYIKAKPDRLFFGYELMQAILNQGFIHGNLDFFHFIQEQKTLFSLTAIEPPGNFNLNGMGNIKTSGLCLFMQPHRFEQATVVFDCMFEIGKRMAEELDGIIEDENFHLLTPERSNYWHVLLEDK